MRHRTNTAETTTLYRYKSSIRLYNTHKRIPYLTESCMVLQMCSMALRITGSLVSSTWCLKAGKKSRTSIQNINVSATTLKNLMTLMNSYLMKTSMMDLQTSTLTLSFWNMSRKGRNRSCRTEKSKSWKCSSTDCTGITVCSSSCRNSPWRRGRRSRGGKLGSSWSPTAATRRTDTRQLLQSRKKEEDGE